MTDPWSDCVMCSRGFKYHLPEDFETCLRAARDFLRAAGIDPPPFVSTGEP